MKLPIRLENAITKLYNAFHNGTLNAFDCKACAVGNICDNTDEWAEHTGNAVTLDTHNNVRTVYAEPNTRIKYFYNGYNQDELYEIESRFLNIWIGQQHLDNNKNIQFKGVCAVVEYLCKLDNIPNVMDYTKLFETENDKPKYQLI